MKLDSSEPDRPLRVAMFIGRFPVVSETFILRQVTGLLELGHAVDVYSDTGETADGPEHPEVAKYRLRERTTYMNMPPETCPYEMPVLPFSGDTWPPGATRPVSNRSRMARALPLLAYCAVCAPRLTWRVLQPAEYGYQAHSLSSLYRLHGVMQRERSYDILHAHYGPVGNSYRFARDLFKAPCVVSFYGYDAWAVPRKEGPEVYRKLFATADRVLVLADAMGRQLQALGCPAEIQTRLAVGVRVEDFPFRERSRLPDQPVRFLTVARFVEKKGIADALRAFAEARKRRGDLQYDLVGDGPLRGRIEKLIQELDLQASVTLHGYCEGRRLRDLMDAAHVLVLSSVTAADGDQECTPVSLMDAQASGLPVLATRHSGIPEVIRDGESGFLVAEHDVTALAERMMHLANHPELWPQMGRAGRRHVEEHYNCEKLSRRLVQIYRDTIAGFHGASTSIRGRAPVL
jgi:colanic acid/amylovoran biosynthesis glycosyltransferase